MNLSGALFTIAKSPLGEFIVGVAFGRLSKLLPIERVKETDKVIAFRHPKPYWKWHILIVPKKAIRDLASITVEDEAYIVAMFLMVQEIVKEKGWNQTDYTIVTNGGSRQEVPQLHFHLGSGSIL